MFYISGYDNWKLRDPPDDGEPAENFLRCRTCDGVGYVRAAGPVQPDTRPPFADCPACDGYGDHCGHCGNAGCRACERGDAGDGATGDMEFCREEDDVPCPF